MTNLKLKTKRKKVRNARARFNRSLRTSFLLSLTIRIVFFPIFLIAWYFSLMKTHTRRFLVLNITLLLLLTSYITACYITLPSLDKLYYYKPALSSKFYDRNDELIFEVGKERRTHIDIDEVPKQLIYAFIAAEDRTFYTNPGIDLYGLIRAAIVDFSKIIRRQKLQGASTITQQVVKNVLLTNKQTISRKLKEIILSYRITKMMPKDKIMEIYLNHIYLGMQSYGIVVASEQYFGKTVAQLTVPEMAMLAAMPKAPSSINPFKNYNRAIVRRNYVLQRMLEDGYITPSEYEEYSKTDLVIKKKHNFYAPFYAPSFFAQSLLTSKETGLSKENILNDGYKIKLTIDAELQRIAQNALNTSLEEYSKKHGYSGAIYNFTEAEVKTKLPSELLKNIDEPENINRFQIALVLDVNDEEATIGFKNNTTGKILLTDMLWAKQKISEIEISEKKITSCKDVLTIGDVIVVDKKTDDSNYYTLEQLPQINGGVLAINPKTGEILAMVGGYADLAGSFNRTIQAFRQMGSIIKPFVYATALEQNYTPTSIFMDADVNINIGNGIIWTPANDSKNTSGPMTLRTGLEKSRNTVTIRIAEAIGLKAIRKNIIKAGLNKKPENNLSIAIGSVESSLINIATAYSSFANQGLIPDPYIISYVKDIKDKSDIKENEQQDEEELTEKENNNTTNNILNKIYFKDCNINAQCKIFFNEEENSNIEQNDNDNDKYNNQNNLEELNNNIEQTPEISTAQQVNKKHKTLFTPQTSYQILNILQGAVKRGTSYKLSFLDLPIAAKTGTSNDGKDLWSVVLSPNLVIVSFVGYDIPVQTNNYGSQYALPINKTILSQISKKYTIEDFITPEGIKFLKVNRLTGKLATDDDGDNNIIFEAFKETDDIVVNHENEDYQSTQQQADEIDITDL